MFESLLPRCRRITKVNVFLNPTVVENLEVFISLVEVMALL